MQMRKIPVQTLLALAVLAFTLAALAYADQIDRGADLPLSKPVKAAPAPKPTPTNPAPLPPPPAPVVPEAPLPPAEPAPQIYGKDLNLKTPSIIYVIDISGSMDWDHAQFIDESGQTRDGSRLDRAKAELIRSLRSLPKGVQFNLEAYDCNRRWCFVDYGNDAKPTVPADDGNRARAEAWVKTLVANGSTGTGPAVVYALTYAPKTCHQFVLLTDGAPNCGAGDELGTPSCLAAHLSQIRYGEMARGQDQARIDVFGIGASGEFRKFCTDVAGLTGGSYVDVR